MLSDLSPAATFPSTPPVAVVDLLLHLSSARTLEQIGDVIRQRLRRIVAADGIAFILRDGDRCHYFDEDAVGPLWKGQKFPMTHCVSGWAMLNRQSVVIEDIYVDSRVPHEAYRPTFVKSMAMVPIRPDSPLGAIGIYWAVRRRASPDELDIMQVIVNAAALAIENANLFEGMRDALAEVTQRKRDAEAALAQRDALLREVHHRVKNNFQTVISMLRLQQRHGGSGEQSYARSVERIRAMAMVHEHLYQSSDLSRIDVTALLRRLAGAIAEANDPTGAIAVSVTGEPSMLDLEEAIPLSLLVNEIVTNSYKHAFTNGHGEIAIAVSEPEGQLSIAICDNGRGFDSRQATGGLGLRLVEILSRQLNAAAHWDTSAGTSFRIAFDADREMYRPSKNA